MLNDFTKKLPVSLDFSPYESIFVGFSGGADSTALLLILKELQKTYSFRLTAVHFEHGIRGKESIEDAIWCRNFCEKLTIEYKEFSLTLLTAKHPNEGIEEAARRLRLEKWAELASDKKSCVALGHHSGDKIENLFIRFLRGSNSSGLTSLRYVSKINGIIFIRPLFDFAKSQIEELLRAMEINDWRIDSTNLETTHRRNFIRNELIPLLQQNIPNALPSLNSAYSAIQCDAEFIEEFAFKETSKISRDERLSISYITSLHPAVRIRVMRHWLTSKLGFEFIPSRDFTERFNSELLINHQKKSLIPINGDNFLLLHKDSISLIKNEDNSNPEQNFIWNWKENNHIGINTFVLTARIDKVKTYSLDKNSAYFDARLIPNELLIRYKQYGDRFMPFGYDKEVKVSKVLQNEKIAEREKVLLLADMEGIIYWVIGVKRSDLAKATDETKEIVSFSIENKFD
ncbi:MAG: tRNA lysidine(34) synthetase TilS [Lentisphaerota bacterium]